MAIITEHENQIDPSARPPSKSRSQPQKPTSKSTSSPSPKSNPNPFIFWFYLTITASIITVFFIVLSSLRPQDPKTWFLNLPTTIRTHYSNGRFVKAQISPNHSPIDVFTYSQGPKTSEFVLIIHGLGCSSLAFRDVVDSIASKGAFAMAIDLPGSGFSEKAVVEEREKTGGVFERFWDVYDEIKEKGVFWAFDNLVERGYFPYDEQEAARARVSTRKSVQPLHLGSVELGKVLGQVVDSMGLAPLHLVLHDSALLMSANWVVENAALLKSLTLLDTMPRGVAFPLRLLKLPLVREVVLGSEFAFSRLVDSCCSKSINGSIMNAHRVFLQASNARAAIVGTGNKLNQSFDLAEWASLDGLKSLPIQVLWSSTWSEEWSEEGRMVSEAIPRAKFASHSGGRWPQGDALSEVAEHVVGFISSLPKTVRENVEDHLPEHIHQMVDDAKGSHLHAHVGHGQAHAHVGYPDAYGLGHAWGS